MSRSPKPLKDYDAVRAEMKRLLDVDAHNGWYGEPSVVDQLANIAYSDSLQLCHQLYERQLVLQNQLRAMSLAWHEAHCTHTHT